jgi:mono/diheme cytochrome c family protein
VITSAGVILALGAVTLLVLSRGRAAPAAPRAPGKPDPGPLPAAVTYSEHVAPILYRSCTQCHRPGQPAPFPLLTYRDAQSHAAVIAERVTSRTMPPWPADPDYSHFADERVLTDREIAIIARWAETGAVSGDTARLAPAPTFPVGSMLGTPDLVLRMPRTYRMSGDGKDHFVTLKIPYEIPRDTFVRAIEFVPGNPRLVHHMNGHLMQYAPGAKRDIFRGQNHYVDDAFHNMDDLAALDLLNDDGSFPPLMLSLVNYLPGAQPRVVPEEVGSFVLPRQGALIVNQIHYGPSFVPDSDRSYFNIFYGKVPPRRHLYDLVMGTVGATKVVPDLIIPPNTVQRFYTEGTIPADISIVTMTPHMHLLGQSFLAYAVTPARDTIPLIRLRKWDFRWQYAYKPKTLLHIPRGSLIHAEGVYDNTSNNPLNPFKPPQTVQDHMGSMKTTDEMFQFILVYVRYEPGDEAISLEGHPLDH